MLNRGYSTRPTHFGSTRKDAPLVLYISNAPYSTYADYSFIENALPDFQVQQVLLNSFNLVTQGKGTLNGDFPECLGAQPSSVLLKGWAGTHPLVSDML
ncbi:hypothetical protein DACRYDRAFT_111876 [Dacryopinax primogenitus]|uniref:Lysophospholipase n=1 Tax=Dacryopinax primogenitus (strain DJM 731) TaxID=1858805 RepID=M5FPV1_DACPD|nr:uncharacterized protein DACRYDRAFT_111876 [Dacryopinax primogenitus]EJT97333.1 hypothetical protein DACRYDRAFT_111876 [Dacryopinax primogenitus]